MTAIMSDTTWRDPDTWRAVFGTQVVGCRVEALDGGNSPSRLCRIHLEGAGLPASVIAKQSQIPWSAADPEGFRREGFVYQHLLAAAAGIAPRLLHADEDAQTVRLILEDLQPTYVFRSPEHRWTAAEIDIIADLFARLHGATQSASSLDRELLMPAPDTRWSAQRIHDAGVELNRWARDHGYQWNFAAGVEIALQRFPAGSVDAGTRCLVHSDFNPGNIALEVSPATDGRLLDWHIAAAGGAGFDLGNLFFQPWSNHRDIDPVHLLDAYDAARHRHGLEPWHSGDRADAFAYARRWCALSYLPAIANRTSSSLSGWWLHTAWAAHETLTAARDHR